MAIPQTPVGYTAVHSGGVTQANAGSNLEHGRALQSVCLSVRLRFDDGDEEILLDLDPRTFYICMHRGYSREPATEASVTLHGVTKCTSS